MRTDQQAPKATGDFDLCVLKCDLHNVPSHSLKMMLERCSQYDWLNAWQTCSSVRTLSTPDVIDS